MTESQTVEDTFHLGVKALIRNEQGDILLLQVNSARLNDDKNEYWDLPGGRVQRGHTVLDTLRREVEEETGVKEIDGTRQIGMVLSNIRIPVGDESVGLILSIYECNIPKDIPITISDEHLGYKWFSPAHAAHLLGVKYPVEFCEQVERLA